MLAETLTFHEPSSLRRPPSVPHIYVMRRKEGEKESVDVHLSFSSMPECPRAYVGEPVLIFMKGEWHTKLIMAQKISLKSLHLTVLLTIFYQVVSSLHNINLKRLVTCLTHHGEHHVYFNNCRCCSMLLLWLSLLHRLKSICTWNCIYFFLLRVVVRAATINQLVVNY